MRKIHIYKNGVYVCTTMQKKTCRDAVKDFKEKPFYVGWYKETYMEIPIVLKDTDKITAHFAKY